MSTLPASSSKSECRIGKRECTDPRCTKCSRSQPCLRDRVSSLKNGWKLKATKCKCEAKTTSTTELRKSKAESKCSCHKNTSTSNLAEYKCFDFSHMQTDCERPSSSCCNNKAEEPSCSGLKDEEILWNRTANTCSFLPQCCGNWTPEEPRNTACCPVTRDPLLPSTCYEQHPCTACCYPGYLTSYSESYKCRPVPPPPRPIMQPWNTWPGQCYENMNCQMPCAPDCYMPERCQAGGGPSETGDSDAVSEHSETTSEPAAPAITPMCYLCPCCNTTNGLHCMTNDSPMKIMAQECHGRYGVYNFQPYFQHYTSGCGME